MSSFEPDRGCDEIDCCEEVSSGFVISRGDCSVLFDFLEEVLDQVPRLVGVRVIASSDLSVGLGGDDGGLARRTEDIDDPLIGVVGLVGKKHARIHGGQEVVGTDEVVSLTA